MSLKPVTLSELAAMRDRSYAWAQRHWHELPIERVPGPGQPAFVRASVEAWLSGSPVSIRQTPQPEAGKSAANDPLPEDFSPDVERLTRAFGGH